MKKRGLHILKYLKDYRFGSIFIKYFLLLFLCLVVPAVAVNIWYGKQSRKTIYDEIIRRNEAALEQAYEKVERVFVTSKNLAYSLSVDISVTYLAYRDDLLDDTSEHLDYLKNKLSMLETATEYIDSVYVYFKRSNQVVTKSGHHDFLEFQDIHILEGFSEDMPAKAQLSSRIKNMNYPYLISAIYPILSGTGKAEGMIVLNINVEEMGDYMGSGGYTGSGNIPQLLIFDSDIETLVYSDEYRFLRGGEELEELKGKLAEVKGEESKIVKMWGRNYILTSKEPGNDGLKYFYMTTTYELDRQTAENNTRLWLVSFLMAAVCVGLAGFLALWVYHPIQQTIRVLSDMTMLTKWDKKEHIDEIEAIQRSILSAKIEKDNLNEQIQERIISLHNAQICALQTQINPHFLYNTLESIGSAADLLINEQNQVTDAIFTLGKLMRTSLANENYLVPLSEELEHVNLYIMLVQFRFHGRIQLHVEIPEELKAERVVKLTLQPLIENAIQHGLGKVRSGGHIWLKGEKKGEDIFLHVIDNGEGMTEAEVYELEEQLQNSSITGGSHIGMRNVNQRMRLIFGEEYGIRIQLPQAGGLCVTVHCRSI